MTNKQKIFYVKLVHTLIYIVMVLGIFYILYAGITQTYDKWLYVSLALFAIEAAVYLGNKRVCPLTEMAKKYGDPTGYVGDIFIPKKVADNTFYIFGTLFLAGIAVLLINLLGLR